MNNFAPNATAVDSKGQECYSDATWVNVADWLKDNFSLVEIANMFEVREVLGTKTRVWVPSLERQMHIIWETEGWK